MKVDIVITCYNKENWVGRAITSVKEQTLGDFTCVVVDDGSTDNSTTVIRNAIDGDDRFQLVELKNSGVANARNYGIHLGTTPYICCLDADDALHPRFLQVLYDGLESNPLIGIGFTTLAGITHKNTVLELDWGDCDHDKQFDGVNQVPCCNLFRRTAWERTGGYNQRYAPLGAGAEDAELWLRVFEIGYKAKQITKEPLFVYSLATGLTKREDYTEVDWLAWHRNKHSFASVGIKESYVDDYSSITFAIIIPVGHGHEHLVFDALDSIENQTRKDWEVCVVWDTDKDEFYYQRLINGYPYVRVVFNETGKHGAGISRNIGAAQTTAPYLVFLDADDYLQPKFLELTHKFIKDADWVYTDLWSQTFEEKPVEGSVNIKTSIGYESVKKTELKEFTAENQFYGGTAAVTALYKRSDFEQVGGFDEEYNREDWDFHMRLAMAGKCGFRLPSPLFTYRLHAGYRREYKGKAFTETQSKALKQADVRRIQEKYPLEKLEMACTRCKKKIQPAGADEMRTMDYAANPMFAQDGMIFTGKVTGRKYVLENMKIFNVHPQDAEAFMAIRMFRPTPGQEVIEVQEPVVAATQAPVQQISREEQIARNNKWVEEQMAQARAEAEAEEARIAATVKPKPKRSISDFSLSVLKKMDAKEPMKPEVAEKLLAEELDGKGRKTVIAWLEKKLD